MNQSCPARALVVEDNPINQQLALGLLEALGYAAEAASDGTQALKMLEDSVYDIVLMDCRMPGMDGYETTRALRARAAGSAGTPASVPIVGLTADAYPEDRERCLEAGMSDYLSKPVGLDQLQAILERWVPSRPGAQSAAPPARTAPVLSPDFVSQMIERLGVPVAAHLVRTFARETVRGLEALRKAAAVGNREQLAWEAHSLKGACLNVGAESMAAILNRLQRRGDSLPMEEIARLVEQLADEATAAVRELESRCL